MMGEFAKPRDRNWHDGVNFKNLRLFTGDVMDWREFSEKLKGQVASGSMLAASILDYVETKISETDLEEDDFATMFIVDGCDEDQATRSGTSCTTCCLTSRPRRQTQS